MSVLSSEYQHPKIAIAVDVDVDIFNYAEVLWSINTRVNPSEDIVTIPGAKIHAMDPSCPEFGQPGAPGWHRIGGKMIIDATKPPECDAKRRNEFERLKPVGWETVNLEDFLPAGAFVALEISLRGRPAYAARGRAVWARLARGSGHWEVGAEFLRSGGDADAALAEALLFSA